MINYKKIVREIHFHNSLFRLLKNGNIYINVENTFFAAIYTTKNDGMEIRMNNIFLFHWIKSRRNVPYIKSNTLCYKITDWRFS